MNRRGSLFCFSIVPLFVCFLASSGAQKGSLGNPWGPSHCPPDKNPQFFAPATYGNNPVFMAGCFSWYLRSLGEQPLPGPTGRKRPEVYRVLVLPAFSSPVVVRLTVSSDGTAVANTKIGKSDLKPEDVVVSKTTPVTRGNVDDFLRMLESADFWRTRSVQQDPAHHTLGGMSWVLEGYHDGLYHVTSWVQPKTVPCSAPAAFLVTKLGKVDLRRLPTQPSAP